MIYQPLFKVIISSCVVFISTISFTVEVKLSLFNNISSFPLIKESKSLLSFDSTFYLYQDTLNATISLSKQQSFVSVILVLLNIPT